MLIKLLTLLLIVTKINGDEATTIESENDEPKKCNNGLGECVPYYLCKSDRKINIDGSFLLNSRSKRFADNDNDECIDYFEECCEIDNIVTTKIQTSVQAEKVDLPETCGWRNSEGLGLRITGNINHEAEYGEFPWMAAVFQKVVRNEEKLNKYRCGGSLIAPNIVLTAADCLKNVSANDLVVRLGEWDAQSKDELFPHADYSVINTIIHEEFNSDNLHNDIALLFLNESVPSAEHIGTICLPPQNQNFDGKKCIVSGWGKDLFGKEGKYQPILKKIELPIIPFDECQQVLRKQRLGRRFILHEGCMCAGGERKKDVCEGDGGSPLVCPIDGLPGRYFQAGIVSWGIGCGEIDTPGVYTNIAYYRPWIDKHIASKTSSAQ